MGGGGGAGAGGGSKIPGIGPDRVEHARRDREPNHPLV